MAAGLLTLSLSLFSHSVFASTICTRNMAELVEKVPSETPVTPASVNEVKDTKPSTSFLERLVAMAKVPFAKFRAMSFGPKSSRPFTLIRFLPHSLKALRDAHFDFETSNDLLSRAKAVTISVLAEQAIISDANLQTFDFNSLVIQMDSGSHQREELNRALAIVNRQLDEELRTSLKASDQKAHRFLLSRNYWMDGGIKRVRFVDAGGGQREMEATLASRSSGQRSSMPEISGAASLESKFFSSFDDPETQKLTLQNWGRVRQLPNLIVKDIQELMGHLSKKDANLVAALIQEAELSLDFFKLIRGLDSEAEVREELLSWLVEDISNTEITAIVDRIASRSIQLQSAVKFFVPAAKGGEASVQRIEQAEHINTVTVPENARYFLRADGRSVGAKGMLEIFQGLRAQPANEFPNLDLLSLTKTASDLEKIQQSFIEYAKALHSDALLEYFITGDEILIWFSEPPKVTDFVLEINSSLRFSGGSIMDRSLSKSVAMEIPKQLSIRDQGLLGDIAEKALKMLEAEMTEREMSGGHQYVSISNYGGKLHLNVYIDPNGELSNERRGRLSDFVTKGLVRRLAEEFQEIPNLQEPGANADAEVIFVGSLQ